MVAHQAQRHFPGDTPTEKMVSPQQSPPKQSVGSSLEDALEEALFLFLFPLLWYRILWSLSWGLLFLMKNTSRKSVQDRFNLMWKRISNAHCVRRILWSALAFKYPDLKMPQCFEGKEEENFFVFVFLISFRKKIKKKKKSHPSLREKPALVNIITTWVNGQRLAMPWSHESVYSSWKLSRRVQPAQEGHVSYGTALLRAHSLSRESRPPQPTFTCFSKPSSYKCPQQTMPCTQSCPSLSPGITLPSPWLDFLSTLP